MKKMILALAGAFLIGGAAFAENHTCGLDIAWSLTVGGTSMDDTSWTEVGIAALLPNKISTYDCFLLDDHLGIYASFGYNLNFGFTNSEDFLVGVEYEFKIGPAFGIDLGRTRFQTGLAFHYVGAKLWSNQGNAEDYEGLEDFKFNAFGLSITPQFRFTADRRVSFILGCDLDFDFGANMRYDDEKFKPDSSFRFAAVPYLGLGINFGD